MSLPNLTNAYSVEFLAKKLDNEENKTFCQKFRYIINNITVEPLLFLLLIPSVMNNLTTLNLNLEKACRVNLQYNSSVCDAMVRRDPTGYEPFQEREAQKLVSTMTAIKMIIVGSYPTILMLFVGSWSDRHGRRKPLILMPILGDLVGTICLYFCAYFFLELSVEWSMMAETIPFALCGTWTCEFLGLYTYVSGLCKDEERTIRIGAVTMCQIISMTLGMMLSGIMIKLLGFKGVYLLSSVLLICSFLYGVIIVKECNIKTAKEKSEVNNSIKEFFSLKHIQSTFKICFKNGANNRRSKMIVLMLLSFMVMGPLYGEYSVTYLYTRLQYNWNEVDFSIYNTIHSVVQVVGGSFALSFFSKYLGIDDAALGMIATVTKICACVVYAFAPTTYIFYIGAFVEVFHSTCHIAMRSIMAKLVPPQELGQSNSVFAIFESITPLLFGPIYTNVYNKTINIFPGSIYMVTSILYLITLYLFFWMYRTNKKDKEENMEQYKKVKQEDGPHEKD
ncbi:solute carrier family 46 member 3-like [Coccinella septempunctata]|uniref:solute carrier family 46 member 3-like n=1 Tax=Coccinella septempunctata TaxID=41139 RepID=UPI001D063556|nr:solute carrier family 46 member 3-like [Coccinella septempunctata]